MSKIYEIKITELKSQGTYDEYELQEIASKMILNLQLWKMDFCGCGRQDDISFMIRDILRIINNKTENYDKMDIHEAYKQFDKELIDILGFDSDNIAFEFILHTLNSVDVLEHGSSVFGSWLTDYGKEILCAFEIVGDIILDVDYWDE